MINTSEQRKWSWLQEGWRLMMPGVSRCWSRPSGADAFGTAVSSLEWPFSGPTSHRERLSEEIESATDSL